MPDTLVHGDFHPGNVRGTPFRLTLLDWGDTGVGQPLLDLPAFLAAIPAAAVAPVRDRWIAAWRARLPGRATRTGRRRSSRRSRPLARPSIYQRFVDGIEPVERRHHDADAREWLGRCAALVEGERPSSIDA